jgi:hypothetical protein
MKERKTLLALAMVLLSLSLFVKADNLIEIKQGSYYGHTGDDLNLNIVQKGSDNKIQCYQDNSCWATGDDMALDLRQVNTSGVDNVIEIWHLEGDNNQIRFGQGTALSSSSDTTFNYDGTEGGGHYARFDIHGDGNSITGSQTNQGSTTGHYYAQLIFSDNNVVWVKQMGNGRKTINLHTSSDGNQVSLEQIGNNAEHNASISLRGTHPTTLNMVQQGTTTQNYSLTQTCITVGGCSVSITQGD